MISMGKSVIQNIMYSVLDAIAPLHCEICSSCIKDDTHVHRVCNSCLFMFEDAPKDEVLLNQLYKQKNKESFILYIESYFAFHNEALIQKAIHAIKYGYAKQMAFDLGYYVARIKNHIEVDYYVPVPLHPARCRERGYNQSQSIAQGISFETRIPVINALKRMQYSITQTKLSSYDRMNNVQGIFTIPNPERIRDKRLMLVDDVITTGSTLEECAQVLLEAGACSVSALTIAAATPTKGIQ